MDKNESSFIPQWLNRTGGVNCSGNVYHQGSSSSLSLHSVRDAQYKLSSSTDHDAGQKYGSESTSSTYFSWSSRKNSSTNPRPYSSFASASTPVVPIPVSTLSMAETVALGSSPVRTPPLLNGGAQRLEELAVKQSRQLIPVIPSTPKNVVVSPSEKSKPKIGQQVYQSFNQTRGGIGRAEGLKTTNETRLQILKPSRDVLGVASGTRDGPVNGTKPFDSQRAPMRAAYSTSITSSQSTSSGISERKPGPSRVTVEKRLTAQAQSRNDFFNLIKKKAMGNSSPDSINPASGPALSSPTLEKSHNVDGDSLSASATNLQGDTAPSEPLVACFPIENESEMRLEEDICGGSQKCQRNGEKNSNSCALPCPDEEEAAFLRSLGWEESVEEDGGLTEEEIIAFYQECLKLDTSVKLLNKLQSTLPLHSHDRSCGDTASV